MCAMLDATPVRNWSRNAPANQSLSRGQIGPECWDNPALSRLRLFSGMSSIQVRPATLRDAKAIAQIQVSAAQDAYKDFWPDAALNGLSVAQRQAYWREAINMCEPQVLVAHLDNEVMGFVGFDRSRDKGTPSTTGEIWAMYAAPAHWDKGVGQALVEAAQEGLQEEGCTRVTLWTYKNNERALRFFGIAGFAAENDSVKAVDVEGKPLEQLRLQRSLF